MRTIFSSLLVGFGFLLLIESVSACVCETSGSREMDFDQAKAKATAIFVGRVVDVVDVLRADGYSEKRVKLKLERYWEGQLSEEVSVFTGRNDCMTTFRVGQKYLVLAYPLDGERELYTDHCMKSGSVRKSSYQLKRLGKGKRLQPWVRTITNAGI